MFADEKLTTALLDRVGHHAHIITTKGVSYRTAARRRVAVTDSLTAGGAMTAGAPMRPLPRRAEQLGAETTLIRARHGPSAQGGSVWIPLC